MVNWNNYPYESWRRAQTFSNVPQSPTPRRRVPPPPSQGTQQPRFSRVYLWVNRGKRVELYANYIGADPINQNVVYGAEANQVATLLDVGTDYVVVRVKDKSGKFIQDAFVYTVNIARVEFLEETIIPGEMPPFVTQPGQGSMPPSGNMPSQPFYPVPPSTMPPSTMQPPSMQPMQPPPMQQPPMQQPVPSPTVEPHPEQEAPSNRPRRRRKRLFQQ